MQNISVKRVPQRKCVGCGEMIGKKGALRVVRDKDGNFYVDPTGKKNGRGAYICNDTKCLELAKKGKKLERSFKCQVPLSIYEELEKEINKELTENQ
ncbi:MAG: YlxR family protein [Oscillospiraceae bacterium]|nr:YlxR family protein [Oscillospiraceae bacterium]